MPVYNGSAFLRASLDCVFAQTLQHWELVVVDDGSTDGTGEILARAAQRDRRVRVLHNPANLGLGGSLQRALENATAPICARLDADDIALPAWLMERTRFLEQEPDCVLVSGSRALMMENGNVFRRLEESLTAQEAAWALQFGNPVVHPSAVMRRDAALAAGGYPSQRYLEDWALFRRLAEHGNVAQVPEIHLHYRVHGASTTKAISTAREVLMPLVDAIMVVPELESIDARLRARVKWTLFRGRLPIEESADVAGRALGYLVQSFCRFSQGRATVPTRKLAALFLRDVRNVVSAGPCPTRGITHAMRLAIRVAMRGGMPSALMRECCALARDYAVARLRAPCTL